MSTKCPVCNKEVPKWSKHWRENHKKNYGYGLTLARMVWKPDESKERKQRNKLKATVERTKSTDVQEDVIITITDNETGKEVCRLVVKKITTFYKVCLEKGEGI